MRMVGRQGIAAIAVMAKAPRPGHAKTRLVPPLDAEGAAALSAAFLRDTTENIALAARRAPIAGAIAYAPAGSEALFDGVLAAGTGFVLANGALPMPRRVEGFGRSLLHAAQSLFASGYGSVCLLNSDSPTLPTDYLCRAVAACAAAPGRVVLGPAEDGGYYLIGMTKPHAVLFEDIAWSTDQVAAQTRARAHASGLTVVELPRWYDVDDRVSLERLRQDVRSPPPGAFHAPATAACLARLDVARMVAEW
jgi:hypothetical protein